MKFEWIKILYAVWALLIILNIGLVFQGVTQKIAARLGRRYGIRWYQPYIDLMKNYAMRSSITHGVMFYLGPVFRLSGGIGMFLFMPVIFDSPYFQNFSFSGDLILISYFMFFGTLGMALGAGEGGHPYSAIGITRGLSQMTAAEVPQILAIISVAVQYQTISITNIVAAQQGGIMNWTVMTNPFATAAALLALLGSMMRPPFDVVLAPQEIPIGPPTEFHSNFLAVLQTNRAIFPMAKMVLFVNIFFGGATNWPLMIAKMFLLYMWPIFIGVAFPRFRVDQSIRWFIKIPAVIGIIAVLLVR
ncbi:MAG TPA: NADH-quinone oxidoreductase subunit H [bacterium]|jgi:NADH-quinone oxidoreductase subunit H|nr:NADH-quinone oxidoreductase subunit H [bacterium]HNZ53256.1 NADH-quinone oxidoreductase subunit H [bacterium]HOG42701.1 NADH-quinone oxidoreductase subunit H [bacterium]